MRQSNVNPPIVSSRIPITLLGGAKSAPNVLSEALNYGKTVVCADGGANFAAAHGLNPVAIIGDMDSISEESRMRYADVLHEISEQDSTDFDKALRNIVAPLVLGVGFLGDRLDHALAALHVLLKYPDKSVILLGDHDLLFLAPPKLHLSLDVGSRISLLPIARTRVDTKGLRWNVADQVMSMTHFIGSSNEAAEPDLEIESGAGLAIILPPTALGQAIAALQGGVPAG